MTDSYVKNITDYSLTIGVCWDLQLLNEVPYDEHDIMMQWVITEEQTAFTGMMSDAD